MGRLPCHRGRGRAGAVTVAVRTAQVGRSAVGIVGEIVDRGLRTVACSGRRPPTVVSAITASRQVLFGETVSRGSRLVPYIEGPKRAPRRAWIRSLSCADVIEVQVDLCGRIHPKPAPHGAT